MSSFSELVTLRSVTHFSRTSMSGVSLSSREFSRTIKLEIDGLPSEKLRGF